MTIKAALFDLDGTLIDSTEAIVDCFYHTFDVLGIERPQRERIVSTISLTLENQFATMLDHDPHECARIYREKYFRVGPEMTLLHEGASNILRQCADAGIRLGFVTSKLRTAAELLLDRLDVLDYFEARVGPEDVVRPKPDPEPLMKALEQLSLSPGEVVYFGDTPLDVRAAHAAGIVCVGLTTGYASKGELEAEKPAVICANLMDAARWLARYGAAA